MMKKVILVVVFGVFSTCFILLGSYWIHTQPIWTTTQMADNKSVASGPVKNKQIIDFVEKKGKEIAPNYKQVVCTEFVIKVIGQFDSLSNHEKNGIRIITTDELTNLIRNESPIIKGVQTALSESGKGIIIEKPEDVKPGDFIQFWNEIHGKAYGHCGIVLDINPNQSLILYSSHPLTHGYGKQKYLWPDKLFFVRLK